MGNQFDWNSVISVLTLGTLFVTYKQFRSSLKIREIEIYYKLKSDFTNEQSVRLYECIIDNKIGVSDSQLEIPKLIDSKIETHDEILKPDLLNHLEDLYIFYKRKLISKKLIIEGYGTVIIKTYENDIIKLYIKKVRTFYGDKDIYEGLEKLYFLVLNV